MAREDECLVVEMFDLGLAVMAHYARHGELRHSLHPPLIPRRRHSP